ncbi:MAG TPA: glycosyltransferase family 2 protein [Ferruginibacter sp.]|jgi:glycosyltransferase involved in cell wall biosynthesis|nr:glycosyltransferase family 2 protein [Ferruginibacter sp.]
MQQLVSIIIPVYNGHKYILETLVSVKEQHYQNWECIIIDDGSTDDTAIIVQKFIATDKRFKYIHQLNKGLAGARNTGLAHATGSLIQFLDADDVLLPSKIQKQLEHFPIPIEGSQMVVSYTDYFFGRSDNIHELYNEYIPSQFNTKNYLTELIDRWESSFAIPCHCFLFSAIFFTKYKINFDTSLPNHEDFDCWVKIFSLHPQIKYVDEKLCIYRIADGSMSKNMKLMGEGFLQSLNKHIDSNKFSIAEKRILIRKRRTVLGSYKRFDLMSFKDKICSLDVLYKYYSKRILQKVGFKILAL